MAHVLSGSELTTQRLPRQWSKSYLVVPEAHAIYTARLNGVPTSNDMVVELTIDNESGTRAEVLPDMMLYVGSVAGGGAGANAYDLGMCRIRKTPIAGTFYIAETSEIAWEDNAYLKICDDYSIWAKPLRIVSQVPYMDWDIAYSNQHASFDPIPCLGPDGVARLVDATVDVKVGPSSDVLSWVPGSTISSYLWTCAGSVSIDDDTASNTFITFDTAGTYLAYCLITAANGKTFTGVRYIVVWDDNNLPFMNFEISGGRMDYDSGGCSFEVTLKSTFSVTSLRKRSKVILCTEDYADMEAVTLPGQIEGRENILCVGWISNIDTTRQSEYGEISFTVESAEYWMKQIPDYPSGMQLKAGTAAAWTDMPLLSVDRACWHFLHWRSTITRMMDVAVTGDARLATRFNVPRSNLWERIEQVSQPTIFASMGIDNFGRLHIAIDPQMDIAKSFPVVMTLTDNDIEGEITWTRRDVNQIAMLFLSGISVDTSGAASSFFSMSPGHSYAHHGGEETQDNYLVASQANSNQLCGLYYGWKNNDPFDMQITFVHSMRILGMWPRQKYHYTCSAANDPRGIGFDRDFYIRQINFSQDPSTGFIEFSATLEPECIEGPSVNGDVPTMTTVDFSFPNIKLPKFKTLPIDPYIIMPPTMEPTNQPKTVVLYSSDWGVMYTNTFDLLDPLWYFMNNGLSATDMLEIANLVVTPSGKMYILTSGVNATGWSKVFVTDGPGGVWRQIFSEADYRTQFGFTHAEINGLGVNPLEDDQIALWGGKTWTNPPFDPGQYYIAILTDEVVAWGGGNAYPRIGYATLVFTNDGWTAFENQGVGILGNLIVTYCSRFDSSGTLVSAFECDGGANSGVEVYGCAAGTQDLSYFWKGTYTILFKTTADGTIYTSQSIVPTGRQGISMSPTGNFGMGNNATSPVRTSDGGSTWGTAAGTIPVGSTVWENCKDDFRWIFGGGATIRLTMDWGATYVDKMGNLLGLAPLIDIIGIRYIE